MATGAFLVACWPYQLPSNVLLVVLGASVNPEAPVITVEPTPILAAARRRASLDEACTGAGAAAVCGGALGVGGGNGGGGGGGGGSGDGSPAPNNPPKTLPTMDTHGPQALDPGSAHATTRRVHPQDVGV